MVAAAGCVAALLAAGLCALVLLDPNTEPLVETCPFSSIWDQELVGWVGDRQSDHLCSSPLFTSIRRHQICSARCCLAVWRVAQVRPDGEWGTTGVAGLGSGHLSSYGPLSLCACALPTQDGLTHTARSSKQLGGPAAPLLQLRGWMQECLSSMSWQGSFLLKHGPQSVHVLGVCGEYVASAGNQGICSLVCCWGRAQVLVQHS